MKKKAQENTGINRKELTKEIRRILNGILMVNEFGQLAAAAHARDVLLTGILHGTISSRLFGLSHRTRRYRAVNGINEAAYVCLQVFDTMGRSLALRHSPDTANLIVIPALRNPSVMIADIDGNDLVMTVWTARTPVAFVNQAILFSKWEKRMTADWVTRVDKDGRPVKRAAKQSDKAGKGKSAAADGRHTSSRRKKK